VQSSSQTSSVDRATAAGVTRVNHARPGLTSRHHRHRCRRVFLPRDNRHREPMGKAMAQERARSLCAAADLLLRSNSNAEGGGEGDEREGGKRSHVINAAVHHGASRGAGVEIRYRRLSPPPATPPPLRLSVTLLGSVVLPRIKPRNKTPRR